MSISQFFKGFQGAFQVLLLQVLLALVNIFITMLDTTVNNACQSMRTSCYSLGGTKSCSKSAIKSAKITFTSTQRLCGNTQSRSSTIYDLPRTSTFDLAAGYLVIGAQSQPGYEVVFCGKSIHVKAYFAKY